MSKKKRNKRVAFTIATGKTIEQAKKLEKSLRKFHSKKDLPLIVIGDEDVKNIKDKMFLFRATPFIGRDLLKKYETVIKLDADQLITGDISHTWKGKFDIAVAHNSNPRDSKKYPVGVWNINPLNYLNAGFVVMKNPDFVDHWWKLCASPHFNDYQMKEQDLMNIMIYYMPFQTKLLDVSSKWHGLISKGYWPSIQVIDDKLMILKNKEWPIDEDKEIVCLHWAGGHGARKQHYRTQFKQEVIEYLDKLLK